MGCILDMLRSEGQWPLNGSQLNNLAVRSALQGEEHSDNEHVQGSSLGLDASNSNFPYRSPGEGNGKPTPVFLLGEFHGQRSLMGYSPGDRKDHTPLSN